ncbi:MAG: transglutaminase family protein [Bauldia sp.]|nr:transglutaminase family protein [Bauldia sp.]
MRLLVTHRTTYTYATPANRAIQTLRLTPKSHDGQYVVSWRVDVDRDLRLDSASDPFGNTVHTFTVDGQIDRLEITAVGEVLTEPGHGVLSGQVERFPPVLFLRETTLTTPDAAIVALAEAAAEAAAEPIPRMHTLMTMIRQAMTYDTVPTDSTTTAAEAIALRRGVCQDFAHVFIAAARHLGFPARYVSGYLHEPAVPVNVGGHGWAEAYIEDLGWVGFDPTNGHSPSDEHIRVAIGLDYLAAAPVRGARFGGTGESLKVEVSVSQAGAPRPTATNAGMQGQSQSQ